jgi:hypothetical protein
MLALASGGPLGTPPDSGRISTTSVAVTDEAARPIARSTWSSAPVNPLVNVCAFG